MTTIQGDEDQEATLTPEQLIALLPAAADPDAYLVIPIGVLARQLQRDWWGVAREHGGEVRLGWLTIRHLRSLQHFGHIVNTRYAPRVDR